jgi:C-terminal processing protease CtpA/Prc
LFDREVKIGDLKRRKEVKPLLATTRGKEIFIGDLVVLVESESGSASEVLARVVQLEKRGRVIGDRTAGAVMRSKHNTHQINVIRLLRGLYMLAFGANNFRSKW